MSRLDFGEQNAESESRGGLDIMSVYGRDVLRFPMFSPEEQLEKACLFRATLEDYVANIRSYPRLWQVVAERASELRAGSVANGEIGRYPAEHVARLETFVGQELSAFRFGVTKDPLTRYRARVDSGAKFAQIVESFTTPFLNIDDYLSFGNAVQRDVKELRRWQGSVAELLGRHAEDPGMVEIIDALIVAAKQGPAALKREVAGHTQRKINGEELVELQGLVAIFNAWSAEQNVSFGSFILAADVTQSIGNLVAERRGELVTHNLRLARAIAMRKYWGWKKSCPEVRFDLLDVVQEANIGLIAGVNRFEPERGVKLSTYVTWWVRARLGRYFRDHASIIRVPHHIRDRDAALAALQENAATAIGKGMSAEGFYAAKRLFQGDSAFSGRHQQCGYRYVRTESELANNVSTGEDPISDPIGFHRAGSTPAVQLWEVARRESIEEIEKVVRRIEALDRRLGAILRLRNGLWDGKPWTLDAVGRQFGVSRARIGQLEDKAQARFREIYLAAGLSL